MNQITWPYGQYNLPIGIADYALDFYKWSYGDPILFRQVEPDCLR